MMPPTDTSAKGVLLSRIVRSHGTATDETSRQNATYLITDTDGDGFSTLSRLRFSFSRHDVDVLVDAKVDSMSGKW